MNKLVSLTLFSFLLVTTICPTRTIINATGLTLNVVSYEVRPGRRFGGYNPTTKTVAPGNSLGLSEKNNLSYYAFWVKNAEESPATQCLHNYTESIKLVLSEDRKTLNIVAVNNE
jgi:hypothetical protein